MPIKLSVFSFLLFAVLAHGQAQKVEKKDILKDLAPGHPRLLLTETRLKTLQEQAKTDTVLQRYVEQLLVGADKYLDAPPLKHKLIGPRLLQVSRQCRARVYALGLAWRWTGEPRYANAAVNNLKTVSSFPDWNKSHFLDVAEMANGVAVGYDWLFQYMDEETRRFVKTNLIDKALIPGVAGLAGEYLGYNGWPNDEHNWNQVSNGGLIIGALAVAESDPGYARFIITKAVASLPTALVNYAPDGAWMEGPGYWQYATTYTAYALSAMQTALGTTFGLAQTEGLDKTGYFPIYATGPTGLYLNYADNGEWNARRSMPCLFWLANTYNNSFFSDSEHEMALKYGSSPEHIIWYRPKSSSSYTKDLDRFFGGPVQVALMRSQWDNPEALFVGVKAGYNRVNHGHLDLGNFELDALGKRWVRDLGSDYYNLPGYFDKAPGGERWQYYRLLSVSHNVPLVGGRNQQVVASAQFTDLQLGDPEPSVTVDVSQAYQPFAEQVLRTVSMKDHRRQVEIKDNFVLKKRCDIRWGITTDASIETEGNVATLTLDDKKMIVKILSPGKAVFTVESAEQEPPQARNEGVSRLLIDIPNAERSTAIQVRFSPEWQNR